MTAGLAALIAGAVIVFFLGRDSKGARRHDTMEAAVHASTSTGAPG